MATPTENPESTPAHPESPAPAESAFRVGAELAQKHGAAQPGPAAAAAPGPAPAPRKGGRRPIAEEVSEFLSKNGLVAVPADQAGGVNGDPGPGAGDSNFAASPEFVRDCAKTLLEGIRDWRCGMVRQKVLKLSGNRSLADQLSAQAAPPPGTIDVMVCSTGALAEKYHLAGTWSPEAILAAAALLWARNDQALMRQLKELGAAGPPSHSAAPAAADPAAAAPPPQETAGGI